MPDTTKKRIFPGDTFPVAFECRQPDTENPRNVSGLPDQPILAHVRVLNKQAGEFLALGGVGVEEASAVIEPKTGDLMADKGAIIRYTVDSAFTQTPGDFVLLMTAEFSDGAILTEDRQYKVNEFR